MSLADALQTASLTDSGRVRDHNEDCIESRPDIGLFVLADGMGGYNAGEVASGMVTSFIKAELGRWLMTELTQVTDPDDLVVRGILRRGNPARELAAAAAEASADALVVGAPGRAWHHVAGSVPGWLSRHANCPVIVVP